MSNKAFNRSPFGYTKSGVRRRGIFSDAIKVTVNEDPSKTDRENRKEAVNRISALVENGMDLDKAVVQVTDEKDIQEMFSYLIKNNVDIKQTLKNMYISSYKNPYIPHENER